MCTAVDRVLLSVVQVVEDCPSGRAMALTASHRVKSRAKVVCYAVICILLFLCAYIYVHVVIASIVCVASHFLCGNTLYIYPWSSCPSRFIVYGLFVCVYVFVCRPYSSTNEQQCVLPKVQAAKARHKKIERCFL